MEKEATRRMLSRQDAAEFLRCNQQTISNWIESGILIGHKINGRVFVDADTLHAIADSVDDIERAKRRIGELRDEYANKCKELEDAVNSKREELELYNNSSVNRITKHAITSMLSSFGEVIPQYAREIVVDLVNNGNLDYTAQKMEMSTKNVIRIADSVCNSIRFARYDKKVAENEYLMRRIAELEHENDCLKKGIPCETNAANNPILKSKIIDCDFSVRAINCMRSIGIETVEDMLKVGLREIAKYRNVGRKTLSEIEEFAQTNGLDIR